MHLPDIPLWIQNHPTYAAGVLAMALAILTWMLKRS